MNTSCYLKGRIAYLIEEVKNSSDRRFRLRLYSDVAAALVVLDGFFSGIENMKISICVISGFAVWILMRLFLLITKKPEQAER
jgi:hypothetical protein